MLTPGRLSVLTLVLAGLLLGLAGGPQLSWVWRVEPATLFAASDVMLSVPTRLTVERHGRPEILYQPPATDETISFRIVGRHRSTDQPVPRGRWASSAAVTRCDTGRGEQLDRCVSQLNVGPVVRCFAARAGREPRCLGSFPLTARVVAMSDIPAALAEGWGEVALGAVAHLEGLQAATIERVYIRARAVVLGTLDILFKLLTFIALAFLVEPVLGLAILAVVPAVLFARRRRTARFRFDDLKADGAAEQLDITRPAARPPA